MKLPKYVWIVVKPEFNGCIDLRRYAFSHNQAVSQLKHRQQKNNSYKDWDGKGVWTLFKLVKVNKRKCLT